MSDLVKRLRNCTSDRYNTFEEAAAEIERNHAAIAELLGICKEFVRRVDCGEIRSKRTYARMKAAIEKYNISKGLT